MTEWLSTALWLAGLGHFCVLAASFQAPKRLAWKSELARLSPLNRKLMWTYGGFTVLTIVAFGALTLLLHNEMLARDRAAVFLAGFISLYWIARIAVDLIYFGHKGWPLGRRFVAAHIVLLTLFGALASIYAAVAAR
ncbi:MAG: hypothetical protein ACRD8O_24130 [Bryobacteraceae bacterium]